LADIDDVVEMTEGSEAERKVLGMRWF